MKNGGEWKRWIPEDFLLNLRVGSMWRWCIWHSAGSNHVLVPFHFLVKKLFSSESVTLPRCLRIMETWYYTELWWIIFSRYLQILVGIKLCVNLHLQFILRAKANICSLVIFTTDCCSFLFFSTLVLTLAIQLYHQRHLKFLLGLLLGPLYLIQTDLAFYPSKPLLVPFLCLLCLCQGLVFGDIPQG